MVSFGIIDINLWYGISNPIAINRSYSYSKLLPLLYAVLVLHGDQIVVEMYADRRRDYEAAFK